jgi:hypothetical protein
LEQRTRRAVRAGGLSLALRGQRKDDYIPCTMTTNSAGWEQGWFYLRNDEPGLPLTLAWLDSLLAALRDLAGRGLTAKVVLAHLYHRRIVPLMERPLRIFEMTEAADLVALARSQTLQSPLLRDYAATRARSAVDPKSVRTDESLWDLEMLPTGQLVSGVLNFVSILPVPRVVDAFQCFVCSW